MVSESRRENAELLLSRKGIRAGVGINIRILLQINPTNLSGIICVKVFI